MVKNNRKPFIVAGYPKTGTTWLTRLIGDMLNCPTGGSIPSLDRTEPATEGQRRPGAYIVRKGHYRLTKQGIKFLPKPHRINLSFVGQNPIVLIIRDPRDVAVSGAYYWNNSLEEQLDHICRGTGPMRSLGSMNDYYASWLMSNVTTVMIKYEDLIKDPFATLMQIEAVEVWNISINQHRLKKAIERQSFHIKTKWINQHGDRLPLGREHNLRSMRKGIAGDWINQFTPETRLKACSYFQTMLQEFSYENDNRWARS